MAGASPVFLIGGRGTHRNGFVTPVVLFVLILLFLLVYPVHAEQQGSPGQISGIFFEKTFGQHSQGTGHAIVITQDGGMAAAGEVAGADGLPHLSIVRADGSGNQLFEYEEAGTFEGNSLVQTPDGGFIVAGSSGNGVRSGVLLLKLDSQGRKEWSRTFMDGSSGQANAIRITSDGGYVIAGSVLSARGTGSTGWDGYILKTDDQGKEEWSRFVKGTQDDYASAIVQTPDDGFVVAGTTDSFGNGGNDTFLSQLTAHGDEGWFATFGGPGNDRGITLSKRASGGFAVGTISCMPEGASANCTAVLIRTDSGGNEQGRSAVPVPEGATGTAFATAADGRSHAIAISAGGGIPGQTQIFLTVLDDAGTVVSSRSYSSPGGFAVTGIAMNGGTSAITGSVTGAASQGLAIGLIGTGTSGAPASPAPTEAVPGDLGITIREEDTGNAVPNALVYLDGTASGMTSETEGYILLQHVATGTHSIRVTKEGLKETTKPVDMKESRNMTIFLGPANVIPLITNGPVGEKIDVVFVASKTQYDCPNQKKTTTDTYTANRTVFEQDVSRLIADNYLSLDKVTSGSAGIPSDYKDRFNFYYYWDKDNFADAFDGCSGSLPAHFWENAPFADVAIIVYPTYVGRYTGSSCQPNGCANGMGPGTHSWFKIPANSGKLFLHESGHVVFGLIDSYCGETYYTENDPFPNVWSSDSACSQSTTDTHLSSSSCRQIISTDAAQVSSTCTKQFWRYDPEPDIMGLGAYSYFGKFGEASTARIRYILNSIGKGT
jgi:hypothetical protein